jgi:hypothetical protein
MSGCRFQADTGNLVHDSGRFFAIEGPVELQELSLDEAKQDIVARFTSARRSG